MMKKPHHLWIILLCGQVLPSLALVVVIGLTIFQMTKLELPHISDRELIFWLTEIN
ncbi:MAG: hypothetical protein AAF298_24255 [Cyanobacteria bacterium P01_A01_bin.40]